MNISFIILICLSLLNLSQAFCAITLECSGRHNTKIEYTKKIAINTRTETKLPKLGYLDTKIKSLGNSQYELEIFDPSNPSRSYSTGVLKSTNDFIKWANWDREAIYEIACVMLSF